MISREIIYERTIYKLIKELDEKESQKQSYIDACNEEYVAQQTPNNVSTFACNY